MTRPARSVITFDVAARVEARAVARLGGTNRPDEAREQEPPTIVPRRTGRRPFAPSSHRPCRRRPTTSSRDDVVRVPPEQRRHARRRADRAAPASRNPARRREPIHRSSFSCRCHGERGSGDRHWPSRDRGVGPSGWGTPTRPVDFAQGHPEHGHRATPRRSFALEGGAPPWAPHGARADSQALVGVGLRVFASS